MTRALHTDTQVQRAASPDAVPPEARERGYEERDAPPRTVIVGMASFLVLMVSGLVVAGLLLIWILADDTRPRAPFATQAVTPPPPHLLTQPKTERAAIERAARARLRQTDLARATQALEVRGWPDAEPAPATVATAREHRERLR